MSNRLKYFLFNKMQDYSGSHQEHLEYDPDSGGLRLSQGSPDNHGTFISAVLDSREKGMEWHRLVFHLEGDVNIPFKLSIFTADAVSWQTDGRTEDLSQLVRDPDRSFGEKMAQMAPFIRRQETNAGDILLHGITGRYLWLAMEVFGRGGIRPKLAGLQVYFPRQSWLGYLPEVYQANDTGRFLERYLAIFQSLHEELNQRIRAVPELLDADMTESRFLTWLARWLDIAGSYMWSEAQLRVLLKHGFRLYRKRGTRDGMLEFIRLYIGGDAYLVEYHQVAPYMQEEAYQEHFAGLYGVSPYTFSVIVKKEYVPTQKDYKSLLRVIDEVKPAQMELNLVVLEPYMFLGSHTYMGINSALGEYRKLALDGMSMIPFSRIQ